MGKYNTRTYIRTYIKPIIRDCDNVTVVFEECYHEREHRHKSPPTKSARAGSKKPARRSTRVSEDESRRRLRDYIYRAMAQTRKKSRNASIQKSVKTEERDDLSPPAVTVDEPSAYDAETENAWSPDSESLYADDQLEGSPVPADVIVPEEFPLDAQDSPIGDEGLPTSGEVSSPNDDGPGPRAGSNDSLFAFLSPDAIQSLDLPEVDTVNWEEDDDAEGAWPTELGPEPLLGQRLEETSAENAHEVHVDTPNMDVDDVPEPASVRSKSLPPMSDIDEDIGEFSEIEDEEI